MTVCMSGATVRMHMAPFTNPERERARAWMKACRGDLPQDQLVAKINAFFANDDAPWSITRDRYSKYESGGAPFGRGVFARFVAYWEANGVPAPDLTPPDDVSEPSLVMALLALTDELRASRLAREETEIRYRMLDAEVRSLRARLDAGASPGRSAPRETAGSAG